MPGLKKIDNIISKVSPSKVGKIEKCPFQFHLDSKSSGGFRRVFNPNTFLGIIVHKVIETYVKGPIDFNFNSTWDQVFYEKGIQYSLNMNDPDEVTFTKYHVPYYYPNKLKTQNLIENLNIDFNQKVEAEKSIKGELIIGEIDLFEESSDGKITITDFKSGNIYKYNGQFKNGVKEDHILQLKTYGLYFYLNGTKADDITTILQGLDIDCKESFKFSQDEYENHKNWIKTRIAELNDAGNKSHLAQPAEETCRYCDHKEVCPKLHEQINNNPLDWESTAILNDINVSFQNENNSIDVLVNERKISILNIPDEIYIELLEHHNKGDKILIDRLLPKRNTSIRKWTRVTSFVVVE